MSTVPIKSKRYESPEPLRMWIKVDDFKPQSKFQMPMIIGEFSVDEDRCFCTDRSQLKFFNDKRFKDEDSEAYRDVQWDLNAGMDKVVRKNPTSKDEGITHVLRWLVANKSKFSESSSSSLEFLPFDFVCLRGLLTKMMTTINEWQEDWEIQAMKVKGTIYLCAKETDLKKKREMQISSREKMMCSWGFKFEQYVQTDKPSSEPAKLKSERNEDLHEPINENEEFCCVFKSKLGGHALLYAAEMDGYKLKEDLLSKPIDAINFSTDGHFIELKTSVKLESDRQLATFYKFKSMKWWAQAFMVDIPTVICGFRDDTGFVSSLQDFQVKSLPKISLPNPHWNGITCLNFLDCLLNFIKSTVKEDEKVYTFKRPLRESYVDCNIADGESFLPEWYLQAMFGTEESLNAKKTS